MTATNVPSGISRLTSCRAWTAVAPAPYVRETWAALTARRREVAGRAGDEWGWALVPWWPVVAPGAAASGVAASAQGAVPVGMWERSGEVMPPFFWGTGRRTSDVGTSFVPLRTPPEVVCVSPGPGAHTGG